MLVGAAQLRADRSVGYNPVRVYWLVLSAAVAETGYLIMLDQFFSGIRALDFSHAPGGVRPADDDDWWFRGAGADTQSGIKVDHSTALTYSAVWAATRILTETVGRLPFVYYRRIAEQDKEKARDQRLFRVLGIESNRETAAMPYRETMTEWMINAGNGVSMIERDNNFQITDLWPVSPDRLVKRTRTENQDLVWHIRGPAIDDAVLPFRDDEILHVPGAIPINGDWGRGVIAHARESIGLGLATEKHGASFFGQGANPSGVLEADGNTLKDVEERNNLRKEWVANYGQNGEHQGGIGILWRGIKYKPMSFSNKDAQFLEARQHNITDIARWYVIPPHMLADLSRSTFSNIAEQSIAFIRGSVIPWLTRWEQAVFTQLLTRKEQNEFFAEFNTRAMMRGDTESQFAAYAVALLNGFMSINEVRRAENMDKVEDGDDYRVPLNTASISDDDTNNEMVVAVGDVVKKMLDGQSGSEEQLKECLEEFVGQSLEPMATEIKSEVRDIAEKICKELKQEPEADKVTITTDEAERYARILDNSMAVAMASLRDATQRMQSKHAKAIRRLAGNSKTFLDKIADFYESHEATMAEAIEPGISMLAELGTELNAETLACDHCEAAREELLAAYDTEPECTFAARVNTVCDKWMEQPTAVVDEWIKQGEEVCTQ